MGRFILDQITEGQLDWAPMASPFDLMILEGPNGRKEFPMYSGRKEYIQGLKEKFPKEEHMKRGKGEAYKGGNMGRDSLNQAPNSEWEQGWHALLQVLIGWQCPRGPWESLKDMAGLCRVME